MRLALCNIENMATQQAILEVIDNHKDTISLVITSDPYSRKNGGFIKQAYRNMRYRGYRFTEYLFVKMVLLSLIRPVLSWFGVDVLPSVEQRCKELGIDHIHVKNVNTPEVEALLKSHQIDLLTIYYFDQILQPNIIEAPSKGVVNFHPANLPNCRGLFPIMFSYLYNEQNFGISAHWVENTDIDAGPIIAQQAIEVTHATCLLDIDRQVSSHLPDLFECVIGKVVSGEAVAKAQTQSGSYFSYPDRTHLKLLNQTLKMIDLRWVLNFIGVGKAKSQESKPIEK
ncbi:formyltransferase family protein [Pseudoalteromonas luteoviolacea]|uniref:formyltransferase family protein n=1 Tax=Pseudoalteromonas luteoviolacea TaxID=43657 RepID=UPI00114F6E29|nr:formyltransferase family protein [Pseudoalteromonas luteoviolacea]TQF67578.1 hypothetical protein FLM44_20565 [Pseudoalteromonas luteoviolacea]